MTDHASTRRRVLAAAGPLATAAALLLGSAASPAPILAQEDGRSASERAGEVVSMVELTVTEYADAVADGEVVNAAEYREAREFLAQAASQLDGLREATPAGAGPAAAARLDTLSRMLESRVAPDRFRAVAERVAGDLAEGWGAVSVPEPPERPSAARGAVVYRRTCASCHGAEGSGGGPGAEGLEPPPADLTADIRRREASPARDFRVVSLGIPATSMAGYADALTVQERWDVVAFVQGLRYGGEEIAEGKALALGGGDSPVAGRLRAWSSTGDAARLTDAQLASRVRAAWNSRADTAAAADSLSPAAARSVVAYARTLMGTPVAGVPEADRGEELAARVDRADSLAAAAARLAGEGAREEASSAALRAYMAFEGVEPTLRGRSPDLVREIEAAFGDFRGAVRQGAATGPALEQVQVLLADAREAVATETTFWSLANWSFFIIVREGFEAILIIGAILAFLTKTGNEQRKRDVWGGTAAALLASAGTAFVFQEILSAAPASRELLEGATMLLAVAVLFSVSYWLISKIEHEKWEQYLRSRMKSALGAGSGLALAGVAFLAVYREGFETVIFYAALLTRAGGELTPVAGGFAAGCAVLVVLYVAITRLGVRMPMRPFFGATSGVLYLMAIVFAGSGVRELQEAGVLGMTPVAAAPRIELLGVYPTVETLAAQGVLVVLLLAALWITFGPRPWQERRTEASAEATAAAEGG